MRIPIKATAREPINRPDTYQRLPLSTQTFTCDQQPVHTLRQELTLSVARNMDARHATSLKLFLTFRKSRWRTCIASCAAPGPRR